MNFGRLSQMNFPFQFSSPLGGAAWAVLAGIPVGIIALYFLKLRRRPVQVPSTLLWRRSIEDLHVNSLFQRLRRNLLLFLQLLAIFLAMFALAGPRVRGTTGQGQRFVLAIDDSASMSATDVRPTRLARAQEYARKVVEGMDGDDLAMVLAFSDRAKVVTNYTGDRRQLLARIDAIEPTEATTSLREALQVASGLANPSRQVGEGVVATSINPPKLYIYTDGGFPDVEGFSLGNLQPEVVVIGPPPPPFTAPEDVAQVKAEGKGKSASDNVAILALQTRRNDEKADTYQIFGRVHNYRAEAVETEAQLYRHDPAQNGGPGSLIDAIAIKVTPRSDQSFKFDLPDTGLSELEVRLPVSDAQPLDNRAFTLVGSPRKARVLAITPGNRYLADTLKTTTAEERSEVTVVTPDEAKTEPHARDIQTGRYDLVIFDRVRPERPPEANALYFGVLPPGKAYEKSRTIEGPIVLDWDISHPLMQFVRDLSTVLIAKAVAVDGDLPPGSKVLIESNQGPLAFVAPREGYSDAVVGFGLLDGDKFNTNWFKNISFPLFLFNSIQFLGNARESIGDEIHLPGQPVTLRADTLGDRIKVTGPDGRVETLTRTPQGTFVAGQTGKTGLYHARWEPDGLLPFAVNQFDARESDLAPRGLVPAGTPETLADAYKIKIGYNLVDGTRKTRPSQKDWWRWLALAALGVLLVEWYIYNKRVYV